MRIPFRPADLLSLCFLALLGVLTVLFIPSLASWRKLLATYSLLAAAITALALYRERAATLKAGFYLHVVLTVITIPLIFNSLGDLIAGMQSRTFDDVLIRIDYALFGVHPTVWLERVINPLFTALLQFAYISYYFIPISLGVVLIAKGKHDEFEEALFGIVLCFYLSYIGYLLVPAVGPRFTLDRLQTTDLHASAFIKMIQDTLNGLERNKTDAFPSGHTAIALMTLYYAWKKKEKTLSAVLLPVVLGLIISTVYLRYHYGVDVLAGIALTALTIYLAPITSAWFSRAGHSRDQRHEAP
ncbi:MAG TPA: phosphatase PAP2 family protein [Nitrospirota bacterium]|nr:phosphatase PAP2 family protein [Nitrospirota bacterium]